MVEATKSLIGTTWRTSKQAMEMLKEASPAKGSSFDPVQIAAMGLDALGLPLQLLGLVEESGGLEIIDPTPGWGPNTAPSPSQVDLLQAVASPATPEKDRSKGTWRMSRKGGWTFRYPDQS